MADVMQRQTWDQAFQVPADILKNWQSQLQPGQSLLQFCLLHGHLPESKYYPWAMGNFHLPKVRKDFFQIPPDLVFWELVKNRFAWSAELVPLAEWEGIMMIGCLTLPNIKLPHRHQFVLASAADLQSLWTGYNAKQRLKQSPTAAGMATLQNTEAHPVNQSEVRSELEAEEASQVSSPMLHAHDAAYTDGAHDAAGTADAAEFTPVDELGDESNHGLNSESNSEVTNIPHLPGEQTRAEFEALADAHDAAADSAADSAALLANVNEADQLGKVARGAQTANSFHEDQNLSSESELNSTDSGTSSMISISFEAPTPKTLSSPSGGINFVDNGPSDEFTQGDTLENSDSENSESDEHGNGEGNGDQAEGEEEENKELLEGLNFDTSKAATLDFSSLLSGVASLTSEPISQQAELPQSSAPSFLDSEELQAISNHPDMAATSTPAIDAPVAKIGKPAATTRTQEAQLPATPVARPAVAKVIAPPVTPAAQSNAPKQFAIARVEPVLEKVAASAELPPPPANEFKVKPTTDATIRAATGATTGATTPPIAPPVKLSANLFEEAKKTKIVAPPVATPIVQKLGETMTASLSELAPETSPKISVTQMAPTHETSPLLDNSMLSFVSQISEANHSHLAQLTQKDLSSCVSYDDLAMQTLLRVQNIFENGMILMFQGGQLRPWKWTDMMLSVHGSTVKPIQIQDASIFRIVLRTSLPYHGYVVPNPINNTYFNDFNRGKTPNHVTLVPILIERQISGIIMGLSDVEVDYKTSLNRMQQLAKDVSQELKRLREVRAA